MKRYQVCFQLILIAMLLPFFDSCIARKNEKLVYFKNVESDFETGVIKTPKESIIKPSDIIQINVFCSDEEINSKFQTINSSPTSGGSSISVMNGYLVNDSGIVVLPLLGAVKTTGFNKEGLADTIRKSLISRQFAIDPIVSVRILNYKITFLGEVGNPGVILIPNERISILDAIAMAGDLTINGRRDNILLIRENNGKKVSRRFSLNNDELFNSENFYLQNHDIIYVESAKYKAVPHDRFSSNLNTVITSLNFLLLMITTLQVLKIY